MTRLRQLGTWALAAFMFAAQPALSDEQGQIDFANGLFTRGFYEDAAVEYQAYLDEFPAGVHLADALFRLGESEMALHRHAPAIAAFDRLLNLPSGSPYGDRARLRRAVALYESGSAAEAEIALEQAAATPDTAPEAFYYLGKLYFDAGKPQDSIAAFEQLMRIDPESLLVPYAQYQMAFALLKLGDAETAAVQFTEIANLAEADPALRVECRFRAAEAYDQLGWYDAAVGAYETLRRDYPESDYARRAAYGYAWSLYHAARYADATAAIDEFLRDNPDSPERLGMSYLRGNCLVQQGQYDEAIAAFNQLRDSDPESEFAARASFKIAWSRHMAGDDETALAELDEMLQDGRQLAAAGDAAFLRGEILAKRGDFEAAYEEFRLVSVQYPDSEFGPEALFKGGECLAKLGRHQEAMSAFDTFLVENPQAALADEALLRAGDAAFMAKDAGGAIDRYSQLVRKAPGGSIEEESLFRLGIALHNISNFKVCAETLLKLLDKFPASTYAAEAHLLIADVNLQDAKDPVRAITHYQAALAAAPEGNHAGDALKGLALARFGAKDFPGAAASFIDLIRNHPAVPLDAETYIWCGDQFYQAKDWENAITAYSAFLERIPKDDQHALAWFRIGEARAERDETTKAIAAFERVAEVAPKSALAADAQLRIARQMEKEGKLDEAIRLYEESASANNGEAAARAGFKLGEIYEAKGDFETAARHYMRVAILFLHEELSPESLLRAGSCYARGGDIERARKTFQDLVNEFPESASAAAAREHLAQN